MEQELWQMFLNVASGDSALEGLKSFSLKFDQIKAEDPKALDLDWFARGKYTFMLCNLLSESDFLLRTFNCNDRVNLHSTKQFRPTSFPGWYVLNYIESLYVCIYASSQ